MICTSPRSGSSLLCEGLKNTGRAGAPAEYFDDRPEFSEYWRQQFGIPNTVHYFDGVVVHSSTANGFFGAKLHWTNCRALRRALHASVGSKLADVRGRSLNELLQAKFASIQYVWLRRRNKVAQGISHYLAICTDLWQISRNEWNQRAPDNRQSVDFDLSMIEDCVGWASGYDAEWQGFFDRHKLRPLILYYEEFAQIYDRTIRDVLDFLCVPHGDVVSQEPPLVRVANPRSLEWEERYVRLKQAGERRPFAKSSNVAD